MRVIKAWSYVLRTATDARAMGNKLDDLERRSQEGNQRLAAAIQLRITKNKKEEEVCDARLSCELLTAWHVSCNCCAVGPRPRALLKMTC